MNAHDLSNHRFAAVAAGGNGQDQEELIELGVVMIDALAVSSEPLVWLVRPHRAIAPHVTRSRGIANADVAGAPSAGGIAADVTAVLGGRVLLTHRARQVVTLLAAAFPDWAPYRVLDMHKLSGLVFPCVSTRALPDLLRHAGVPVQGNPSRAWHEAEMVAKLFVEMTTAPGRDAEHLLTTAITYPTGISS